MSEPTYTVDYSDVISNDSNLITEENWHILRSLYRIRKANCNKGIRIGFLQPDFLWVIYRPMMQNKKFWRTDKDIRITVALWCTNRPEAEEKYGHISDWDVSSVTDMSRLFCAKNLFNDDISRWDVSSVTNMKSMFANTRKFNQAIGNWNVSNVIDMSFMFRYAE